MSARTVYHVVFHDDQWQVKLQGGDSEPARSFDTKSEAIQQARELALREKRSQVVIHTRVGAFEKEFTYGDDPRRSPG